MIVLDLLHKSSLALVTALVEVNELVLLQEIYYFHVKIPALKLKLLIIS